MGDSAVRTTFLVAAIGGAILAASAGAASATTPRLPQVSSAALATNAHLLHEGDRLRVTDVDAPATSETLAFDVERFEAFTADADIVVHGDGGRETHLGRPLTVFLKGSVSGEPGSHVLLSIEADGATHGIITRHSDVDDDYYLIDTTSEPRAKGAAPARLHAERVDRALLKSRQQPWQCDAGSLPQTQATHEPRTLAGGSADLDSILQETAALPVKSVSHTGRVAIESDFEFYSLFNNVGNATTYIGNLIGYASTVAYEPELGTNLQVSSVSLWTTSSDPWTQTSSTLCGLFEFGKYWNQNKTGVSRTIAHFLSGKSLGGGVAWLNALCHGPFFTGGASSCPGLGAESTAWGGDYGFTANIGGSFNISSPTVVWDIYSVSHEIGHNFGSPHSHCYNGLEGNASPIDQCYGSEQNCYAGATSLPGPGRSGTIMSYCHLIGGYGAIALTFGSAPGFNFGVQPGREATHMNSYISSVASSNPACIAFSSPTGVFSDGFDGGTVPGTWFGATSAAAPNHIAANCSASNPDRFSQACGAHVTMTAGNATPVYVQDNSPSAEGAYRVRFYFDPRLLTITGSGFDLFAAYDGADPAVGTSAGNAVFRVVLTQSGAQKQLDVYARTNSGTEAHLPAKIGLYNAWSSVEIDWAKGAGTGHLNLWIDGKAQSTGMTALTNDTETINYVRWGAVAGLDGNATGSFSLDDFVSQRSGYIGPSLELADVATSSGLWPFMQGIYAAEVIPECGAGQFCSEGAITRKEMSKFLLLAKNGASYTPPACTTATFSDVPCSNPYAPWIYEIAREGITSGCATGIFCPDGTITRSQMSVFLMVARGYPPAACPPSSFADVATTSPFCGWINQVAAKGVTAGCGNGNFCPESLVLRGQMSVFLETTFGIPTHAVGP
jgi:hypothetical protein